MNECVKRMCQKDVSKSVPYNVPFLCQYNVCGTKTARFLCDRKIYRAYIPQPVHHRVSEPVIFIRAISLLAQELLNKKIEMKLS